MVAGLFSVDCVLYAKGAWSQIVSLVLDTDIYLHRFSSLYRPVPFVLKHLIRAQVYKPILRHKVVQFPGAAETVARQMPGMIVRLLSRRVSYIRQTPGNGSSFFS